MAHTVTCAAYRCRVASDRVTACLAADCLAAPARAEHLAADLPLVAFEAQRGLVSEV